MNACGMLAEPSPSKGISGRVDPAGGKDHAVSKLLSDGHLLHVLGREIIGE